MNRWLVGGLAACAFLAGCSGVTRNNHASERVGAGSFGDDVRFLDGHVGTVVLEDGDARVVIVPEWQGRVMTSTAGATPEPVTGGSTAPSSRRANSCRT